MLLCLLPATANSAITWSPKPLGMLFEVQISVGWLLDSSDSGQGYIVGSKGFQITFTCFLKPSLEPY
jgi:hypothetical protein